jgi:hypothetical protein
MKLLEMIASLPTTTVYAQSILGALHNLLSSSIAKIIDPTTGAMPAQSLISISGIQVASKVYNGVTTAINSRKFAGSCSPAVALKLATSELQVQGDLATIESIACRQPLACDQATFLQEAKIAYESIGGEWGGAGAINALYLPDNNIRPSELDDSTWGEESAQAACAAITAQSKATFLNTTKAINALSVTDVSNLYQGKMITSVVNVCVGVMRCAHVHSPATASRTSSTAIYDRYSTPAVATSAPTASPSPIQKNRAIQSQKAIARTLDWSC